MTRDQLQQELWGTNTNVDFDQAIAAAINKVREALGDSAENPRFIQTLPRRGYRFIAPVSAVEASPHHPRSDGALPGTVLPSQTTVGTRDLAPSDTLHELKQDEAPTRTLTQEQMSAAHSALTEHAAAPQAGPLTASAALSGPMRSARRGPYWAYIGVILVALAVGGLLGRQMRPNLPEGPPLRVDQVTHGVPISIGPPNAESFLTMAMDGSRVLTSVLIDGVPRLSAIDLDTGDVRRVDVPDEIAVNSLSSISRNGSRLLLRAEQSTESEQPLWIVPSSGGSGRRIPGVLAHDAVWMPDDNTILYSNGNSLFLIGTNEESPQEYARLPGRAFWLRWSPDGKVLRFTLIDPTTHASSLWEMNAATRAIHPLRLPGLKAPSACCGVWTRDGGDFVFQGGDELYQLKEAGHDTWVRQLTNGPLRSLSPLASPSGNRIFFVGLESPAGLEQFDQASRTFRPAPSFLTDANRIDYSNDGKWVAWADTNEKLWRARADGSDKIRLTPDNLEVFLAQWSPDDKHLAVMAKRPGDVWQIYLLDATGGKPELLLKEPRNAADPGWSPDGKNLVFGREPELMGKESGPHDLQFLDIATRNLQKVPGSEGLFSPRWSPDGRWIVALTLDQKSIHIYDVRLQQWHTLAPLNASDPVWSSDSHAVYVHAFRSDHDPILRIAVPSGETSVVADLRAFREGSATNYFFGGVSPAGDPLVQPRIGTGNLYSLDLKKSAQ